MPNANGDAAQVGQAVELANHTALLHAILAELRSEMLELAVSDSQHRQMVLEKFPVTGAKRVLANRTGNGFAALPVPTTGAPVLPANQARLGLQLTNTGTNAIVLYLSDLARNGVPCVYLAGAASWNGMFGNLVWCGNVYAVAQTGASTLAGGEL